MKEPKRYMDNARETLNKSSIEDNRYTDIKYVKSAFGIAYLGILAALDEYLMKKGVSKKELPKKIEEYHKALKKYASIHNGKLVGQFDSLYNELHIAGYYRGLLRNTNIVKDALKNAESFIARLSH